ncbi:MAG: TonB-dependent receptor plug domain-containing protein [Asticcacaulis sp.]
MSFILSLLAASSLAVASSPAPTVAETPDVLITATRKPAGLKAALYGGSVTTFSDQTLERRQSRILSDVLRDVPGMAVSRLGGIGSQTQVRVRGTEANHVQVRIDGLDASDPFTGEYDFARTLSHDGTQLEILRGPQSALYGADALGGVIAIQTATGAERPGVSAFVEHGSLDTTAGGLRLAGVAGALDYSLTGSGLVTDGTSNARKGIRNLSAELGGLSGRVIFTASDALRLTALVRYDRTRADSNPQDWNWMSPTYGQVIDGTDDYADQIRHGLLRADLSLLDGRWTQSLSLQGTGAERVSRTGGRANSRYAGTRNTLSYVSAYDFTAGGFDHSLTFAADHRRETYQNRPIGAVTTAQNARRRLSNTGYVLSYDLGGDRFKAGLALRHDQNKRFRNATTWRLTTSYALTPQTRLRAAAGTGIKAPSNFELFGFNPNTFVGNPNLKAERSEGFELGLDQSLFDGAVRLGITGFDSRLKDEIYTVFSPTWVSSPANRTTRSTQKGAELTLAARLSPQWSLDLAYTQLKARENRVREIRRPNQTGSATLSWRATDDRAGAYLNARYNGAMTDTDFAAGRTVTLKAYTLINLGGDVALGDHLSVYGRVENATDDRYEDVFSYVAPGRTALFGLRFKH